MADLNPQEHPARESRLGIIGCGNLNRSDDGIGVWVVNRLQQQFGSGDIPDHTLRIFDAGTGGMDVMFMARECEQLVIVDACVGAGEPGAIFDAPGSEFEVDYDAGFSLHDFRWSHALGAGRQMFGADFPRQVNVILIEAECLDLGLELSDAVRASGERVADMLVQRIRALSDSDAGRDHLVRLESGNVYLDAETCEQWFPGIQTVGMMLRDGQLSILPVHAPVAGGLLLKVRNARGDRVIHAAELLGQARVSTDAAASCTAHWDAGEHALRIDVRSLLNPNPETTGAV